MKISGIYQISSKSDQNKKYIGSAINIRERWCRHLRKLKQNKHYNKKLQNHYNKYGEEDLIFTILITCERQNLILNEQYYIDAINPYFNTCKIANSVLGLHWNLTDETKINMSLSKKGRIPWSKNKSFSKKHKNNLSRSHKGQIPWNKGLTKEDARVLKTIENKIRKKGWKLSQKSIENIRKGHIGLKQSEKTKIKKSISLKRRIAWNKGIKYKNVFVSGSFDMLHSGHVTFLKRAAEFGNLYVGTGSDYSIEKYKGKKPVCNQAERLFMLKSIRYVKDAFINSGEGPNDFFDDIRIIKPDFLIVNEEQDSEEKRNLCLLLNIRYIVLQRTQEPGLPARSTTKYREL